MFNDMLIRIFKVLSNDLYLEIFTEIYGLTEERNDKELDKHKLMMSTGYSISVISDALNKLQSASLVSQIGDITVDGNHSITVNNERYVITLIGKRFVQYNKALFKKNIMLVEKGIKKIEKENDIEKTINNLKNMPKIDRIAELSSFTHKRLNQIIDSLNLPVLKNSNKKHKLSAIHRNIWELNQYSDKKDEKQ